MKETLYTYQNQPRRMLCYELRQKDRRLPLIFQFYAGERLIGILDAHQIDIQESLREVEVRQLFNLSEKEQRALVNLDLFASHGLWQAHIECSPRSAHVKLGEKPLAYEEVRSMTIVCHDK